MIVTRKGKQVSTPSIFLDGTPLERVDSYLPSSDLSWTPQVESVCTKAKKPLGLLCRCFHNNTGTNILLELYTHWSDLTWSTQPLFGLLLQTKALATWNAL